MKCRHRFLIILPLALLGLVMLLPIVSRAQTVAPSGSRRVAREPIEWIHLWLPNVNKKDLPQVFLIGDSITEAYYQDVAANLKGMAHVGYFASSLSVGDPMLPQQIALILKNYRFDVIHFNNGLHGKDYSEAEYAQGFPRFLKALRANAGGAKLIWASSTPVRTGKDFAEIGLWTTRVKARNNIAGTYVRRAGIPIDDLYAVVLDHPEFCVGADGIHPNAAGKAAEAHSVADSILQVLRK